MSMVLVNKKTLFSNQNTTSEEKPTKTENNQNAGKCREIIETHHEKVK